jgi:hypothetical protein
MKHIIDQINKINDENINELEELYYKLKKTTSKRLLSYLFYTLKNFDPCIIETMEEKVKRKDRQFREKVKSFYNNKCVISGRSEIVCEVAHIKPFAHSNSEEKYDPNNGILLSADLHKLFDAKLFTIDPETFQLKFTKEILLDNTLEDYYKFNKKILGIKPESKKYFIII